MESSDWFVIGVSGVTCSGKTTLANNLYKFFKDPSNTEALGPLTRIGAVKILSQDDYFLPTDSPKHTIVEPLQHINWEIISSLDMDRMCGDIIQILGDKFSLLGTKQTLDAMDTYDNFFRSYYKPLDNQRNTFQTLNILILEGFLLFNHPITLDICNVKFHLHLPYERCRERRLLRVYEPPDVLGYFEMTVWPMYDRHFKEFANRQDIVYLNAEVPQDKLFKFVLNAINNSINIS